jgi:hypothetical protein
VWSIFKIIRIQAPRLVQLSLQSSPSSRLRLSHSSAAYCLWWVAILFLYTHRAHEERMKSGVSVERASWTDDRWCFMSVLDERGPPHSLTPTFAQQTNGQRQPTFAVLSDFTSALAMCLFHSPPTAKCVLSPSHRPPDHWECLSDDRDARLLRFDVWWRINRDGNGRSSMDESRFPSSTSR